PRHETYDLARLRDADQDALPAAVADRLERLPHHGGVTARLEGEVRAAAGQLLDGGRGGPVVVRGVHQVGGAQLFRLLQPLRLQVHGDDLLRPRDARALDDVQADGAAAEDGDRGAGRHLRGVEDRANPRGDGAAEEADPVERGVRADLRQRD